MGGFGSSYQPAAPERVPRPEYDYMNPPVIPCFYLGPGKYIYKKDAAGKEIVDKDGNKTILKVKRGQKGKSYSRQYGWEGYKIIKDEGTNKFRVIVLGDFPLTVMADGYCEIPATKKNKAKLKLLCTARERPGRRKIVKNKDGEEVRRPLWHAPFTEPPLFEKAAGLRTFDEAKDIMVDRIRPWKRFLVDVPQAIMEEATV